MVSAIAPDRSSHHCRIGVLVMREPAATYQAIPRRRLTHDLRRVILRLAPALIAVFGASAAQAGSRPALACSPAFHSSQSLWAAADFDRDNAVDLARVEVRRDRRDSVLASGVDLFAFCKDSVPPIFRSLPQVGLVLSARDIDSDHDQDLVLREPLAGKVLAIWLNDGTGVFSKQELPDFPDSGDEPPSLHKHPLTVHLCALVSPSKSCASVRRYCGSTGFAPGSSRRPVPAPALVVSADRAAHQNRGPPFPSF